MFETLSLETDVRGVATLTLNRPDKHNAMSAQMLDDLTRAAAQLGQDDAVLVMERLFRQVRRPTLLSWRREHEWQTT